MSFEQLDQLGRRLEALEHVPMGSVVVSFVGRQCRDEWEMERNAHLGAMVMVRRHGFSNDQWVIEGLNLLELKYWRAGKFAADPSQIVRPGWCRGRGGWPVNIALRQFPREQFDYLWVIDPPPFDPALVEGMPPVWRNGRSILYRVNR